MAMSKLGRCEFVMFDGVRYNRYPDADQRNHQVYFRAGRCRYLHRSVWEKANGQKVPRGFHVHHRDGNPLNNEPSNLELLSAAEHAREHMTPERIAESRRHLPKAIAAARAWHSSPEGLAWHTKNAKAAWVGRPMHAHACVVCSKPFETRTTIAAVCGQACFARRRRQSGLDDVDRVCVTCGGTFRVNKYAKQVRCSHACAWRSRGK